MTEQFERALRARADAVPDVVAVAPSGVWREVSRRRRTRRARAAGAACALLVAVVVPSVATWERGSSVVSAAVPTLPTAEEPGSEVASEDVADVPVPTGVDAGAVGEVYLDSTSARSRLSDLQVTCTHPAASGTLATRVLLASVTARLAEVVDLRPGDVAPCQDPLLLAVRTPDPLPPAAEDVAADAARLGVTVTWVGPAADVWPEPLESGE